MRRSFRQSAALLLKATCDRVRRMDGARAARR
jgi:hypothetical protein